MAVFLWEDGDKRQNLGNCWRFIILQSAGSPAGKIVLRCLRQHDALPLQAGFVLALGWSARLGRIGDVQTAML